MSAPKHISVVGGSGFIGTRLCQRLHAAGRPFSIVDIRTSRRFPEHSKLADVRDVDALTQAIEPGSIIVHLAAEHRDDVRPLALYDEVNTFGTANICEAARRQGVGTIVFTSSVAVYGFARIGTAEDGPINPFNDYGRTKYEAEGHLRSWQAEDVAYRTAAIVRPTVVFGEQNRGNVYNLLRQIASGRFRMVGKGENRKSLAYVENVAAFLEFCMGLPAGIHVANYIDKPDFNMNELVQLVYRLLGRGDDLGWRIPVPLALAGGFAFDLYGRISGTKPAISSIRVRKFCADSVYASAAGSMGFEPPVALGDALARTVRHEFLETHDGEDLFYSE